MINFAILIVNGFVSPTTFEMKLVNPAKRPKHSIKLTLMSESLRNDGRAWVPKKKATRAPPRISRKTRSMDALVEWFSPPSKEWIDLPFEDETLHRKYSVKGGKLLVVQ